MHINHTFIWDSEKLSTIKADRSLNISYITSYGKYHCKSNLLLPYDLYIVPPLIITPTSIHFSLFFLETDCNLILIFFKNIRSLYGLHHSHTYNRYLMSSVLHCFPLWVKSVITPRTSVFGIPRSIPMQLSPRIS